MPEKRKIRIRHDRNKATGEEISLAYVQRAIDEAIEAAGLSDFREWKDRVETELGVLRILQHDVRDAVGLSYASVGSARATLHELLEGLMKALSSVDEMMRPGDVAPEQRNEVMERLFDRFREPRDPQNDEVEADDYDDPVESILDPDNDPTSPARRHAWRS